MKATRRSYMQQRSLRIVEVVSEDGDVLEHQEKQSSILVKGTERFYTTFDTCMASLYQLEGNEIKVFLWCAHHAELGTNELVFTRTIKERCAAATGVHIANVDKALSRFCREDLMKRVGRGVYWINPDATWRGDLKQRAIQLKLYLSTDGALREPVVA